MVIVTRNRASLLARCLAAVSEQTVTATSVIVVDNASDAPLDELVSRYRAASLLRLEENEGAASAFARGIEAALAASADFVWMMDDDGVPGDHTCLQRLVASARRLGAHLTAPVICDIDAPRRLAFPIRRGGRTRFDRAQVEEGGLIEGFAHLFNGVLIAREAFERIGLPDRRLFIRGDEVEFLLRARRARLRIVTDPAIAFLHPASDAEIHRMLGGQLYAVVPGSAMKRFYQFRNRGWIFSRYGMWGWLMADHLRYGAYYLFYARDTAGYTAWLRYTWLGVRGRLGAPQAGLIGSAA